MPAIQQNMRHKIIGTINIPLGFFVLSLLIIESFLASVIIGANIDQSLKLTCIYIGIIVFTLIVFMVFLITWFKPEHNIFTPSDFKERDAAQKQIGIGKKKKKQRTKKQFSSKKTSMNEGGER